MAKPHDVITCSLSGRVEPRTVRYQRVYLRIHDSVSAVKADIAQFNEWHDPERPHSGLGGQTPDYTYWAMLPALQQAA
jgi:hypothetical protein